MPVLNQFQIIELESRPPLIKIEIKIEIEIN